MGLIENIRGLIGLTGPAGAMGATGSPGVVGMFVATLTKKTWALSKSSTALTFVATGSAVVVAPGWYCVNWSGCDLHLTGDVIPLVSQGGVCVIAGPLT